MKTNYLVFVLLFCIAFSCEKDEDFIEPTNPDAESVNDYIFELNLDPEAMLNVQHIGGNVSEHILTDDSYSDNTSQGITTGYQTKDYTLKSNFDDVAMLRPVSGVIYPEVLVVGNQDMLDGAPNPIAISRSPVTLAVNLPSIVQNGAIVVDNPVNSSVQVGIDNALDWWNNNEFVNDNVNPSNSSYQSATSYSFTQLSLDIGLNSPWAAGSASQM